MLHFTLPIPPSVNHSHRTYTTSSGRRMRVLTKAAGDWMAKARDIAFLEAGRTGWTCPQGKKIVVELTVYWPDKRRRDAHNLHKLICDALEGICFDDDRWALVRDLDFHVDRDEPRVDVTVRRKAKR